tara:strand:- start:1874 stop:2266 length:393 start_codon:yes stop_codon:yes gene_type:complete
MATLNITADIASTGLTTNAISLNLLKAASVTTGGIVRTTTTAEKSSKAVLLAHADYTAASATGSTYVYLKNVTGQPLRISLIGNTSNDDEFEVALPVGTFALFPWKADTANITVYQTSSGTTTIEYGVFN